MGRALQGWARGGAALFCYHFPSVFGFTKPSSHLSVPLAHPAEFRTPATAGGNLADGIISHPQGETSAPVKLSWSG